MSRRILVIASILVSSLAAAAPSSAVASDATLKAEIKKNLVSISPALTEFQNAVDGFKKARTATRLEKATARLRVKITTYKRRVKTRASSTASGARGKKLLLSGLGQFDTGLRQYKSALDKLDAGASKATTLARLRTADRRFATAAKFEDEALAVLSLERPD